MTPGQSRNVNRRLILVRKQRGWSQPRLEAELRKESARRGLKLPTKSALLTMVSRWENGHHDPDELYQELLCTIYGVPPVDLGFSNDEDREAEVESWELTQALEHSSIGNRALGQLEGAVAGYAGAYPRTSPSELRGPVFGHLRKVTQLLDRSLRMEHRRRLVVVAGQLAGVAGNIHFDTRSYTKAWSYFGSAMTAANETDDHDLRAWVLANQSLIPTYSGSHQQALTLIQEAQFVAQGHVTPSRQSWLDALAARAYAGLSDVHQCQDQLRHAWVGMGKAEQAPRRPGIDFFDVARLKGFEGACWLLLKRPQEARQVLTEVLNLRDPADVKGRILVQLDLALTNAQDRDATLACHIVQQALAVPRDYLVEPIMRQICLVRGELEPWNNTAAVKELDEQLRLVS